MSQPCKVLILYFHPSQKKSRVGTALSQAVCGVANVTFRDMYGECPDFFIDVKKEQLLLEQHDLIVFQHPVYWYSCPPLLKLWLDEVLEYGWAYGSHGTKLSGKTLLSAVTAGGSAEAYSPTGSNRYDIKTLFSPFDQTAHWCGMHYAEPFVVHGARGLSDEQLAAACRDYVMKIKRCIAHRVES
jgi:glutathione-regulated potassium-efflux system ancillary protein KefG